MTGAKLIGVGVGPGDPDLLTVKAIDVIRTAPVIAFFAKKGKRGNAREIADKWIPTDRIELPLYYPLTTEIPFDDPLYIKSLQAFYAEAADALGGHLDAGRDVALLAEGDPLFYSSFMHLYVRLREKFTTEIVPGVLGMAGCWGQAGAPIAWGDDVLSVLPGTLSEDDLAHRLGKTHAAIIMKLGANLPKVRAAVIRADLMARAIYVERGTMAGEMVVPLAKRGDEPAPYFSMILIPGNGKRF
jgi:precorrin-2/cobalt-factor-2 C20-methyltransferase